VVLILSLAFFGPKTHFGSEKSDALVLQKVLTDRLFDKFDNLGSATTTHLLVCTDFDFRILFKTEKQLNLFSHKVLLRFEPEVVNPLGYSKRFESKFDAIVSVGRSPEQSKFNLRWPQVDLGKQEYSKFEARIKDEFPIINANKISLVPGELYSLRRQLARELPGVTLFGSGWGSGLIARVRPLLVAALLAFTSRKLDPTAAKNWFAKYSNWRGSTDDKLCSLSRYQIALVIENSREFLSEKLFDAWKAGCIPVYVGLEDLGSLGLPRHLVVEAEPNVESVRSALERAALLDFDAFRREIRLWLDSPECDAQWGLRSFVDKLEAKLLEIGKSF
jgi:hypothetical protein